MRHFSQALVTGASSGLGEALARSLAECKIDLILTGRNKEKLSTLAKELQSQVSVECLAVDLAHQEERKILIQWIHEKAPDLIINNAGFGLYGDSLRFAISKQMEILEVNANAVMEISLEAAKTLIALKRKGTILNISSAASFFIYPNFNVYAASKAFVNHFSQGLHAELRPYGIDVLTACPGQIDTEFRKRASEGFSIKKDFLSMSKEKAVAILLKQIDTRKTLNVFDLRYKIFLFFSYFLPTSFVQKVLKKNIDKRSKHPEKSFRSLQN